MTKRNFEIEIGKEYVFYIRFADGDAESLIPYSGKKCTVKVKQEKPQYMGSTPWESVVSHGYLYEVEFEDGTEAGVFGDELEQLESCIELAKGFFIMKMQNE